MQQQTGRGGRSLRAMAFTAMVAAAAFPLAGAARVSLDEAARLTRNLTPLGAERAGNGAGSIPEWSGGLTVVPRCYKGDSTRYCDPFPQDKPLFTITAGNADAHVDRLTQGQRALFAAYPDSYRMHVYATRRTAAYPQSYYDASVANATRVELRGNGEAVHGTGAGVPYPIPKSGHEPIWNHKLRYLGPWIQRWNNQFSVTTTGTYNQVKMREDVRFSYNQRGATPESLDNVALYFLQTVVSPARLAGAITLVHDTLDQAKEPRRAWQYNAGQRRLRRAPSVGYDNPGTASDGLRTNDQLDSFNGAMDRYAWKLVGKKELYIPYNSYELHSDRHRYADIIRRGHLNQDLARYELHRVWVVESVTRPGTTHIYKRRTFYLDEDSWQIVLADIYDRRDRLWRTQEAHTVVYYDKPLVAPVGEAVYDLQSKRYLAQAFNNEDPENVEKRFDEEHFAPANVSKLITK